MFITLDTAQWLISGIIITIIAFIGVKSIIKKSILKSIINDNDKKRAMLDVTYYSSIIKYSFIWTWIIIVSVAVLFFGGGKFKQHKELGVENLKQEVKDVVILNVEEKQEINEIVLKEKEEKIEKEVELDREASRQELRDLLTTKYYSGETKR